MESQQIFKAGQLVHYDEYHRIDSAHGANYDYDTFNCQVIVVKLFEENGRLFVVTSGGTDLANYFMH